MMKKLFTIIICICAVTAQAQKPNNEALRKLQMAEFAITNLYAVSYTHLTLPTNSLV